ncbi:MAG: hypothetical protein WBI29_00580 [Candidatus Saccharimonadales bacterium]
MLNFNIEHDTDKDLQNYELNYIHRGFPSYGCENFDTTPSSKLEYLGLIRYNANPEGIG